MELKCEKCKELYVDAEALQDHINANHPKDGLFVCIRCNGKSKVLGEHHKACMPKASPIIPDAEDSLFCKSIWKSRNLTFLNMGLDILKPPRLYNNIKVEQLLRMNIDQRFSEEWRVKEVQVWDSERRMKDGGCKICTPSKFNRHDGADEWITQTLFNTT